MTTSKPMPGKRGFLLLEVVLALAVFGMAATGFAVALHRMADAANLAQHEMRLTRILDGALDEALSQPTLEEGLTTVKVPDSNIELDTRIELITNLENKDGQLLQETYRITVIAHWHDGVTWQERSVETWRYGRMYQPS